MQKCYRAAAYLRLSREDGNEESQSIRSQRALLQDYAQKQGWQLVDIYVDDGYSGTNFNRPAFQRLLEDIEREKINLVLTKDLSRLGRNYVQVGYYTEEYFPLHGVRYVALADNYDSDEQESNDFAPFKNVINEWYAKDTSKKIRAVLNGKAMRGEPRNTVFPIFGYAYNEKYERIPDAETAPIVQYIFRLFFELGSTSAVAKRLSAEKVKTPKYYNAVKHDYNKGKVFTLSESELCRWSRGTVRDILVKEEYLGTYKTAQTKSISYKVKKRVLNKESYAFEGRYPPLIDKPTWERANKLLHACIGSSIPMEENPFKSMLYCADCGQSLRIERRCAQKTGNYTYRYYCNNPRCVYANGISKEALVQVCRQEWVSLSQALLLRETKLVEVFNRADFSIRTGKTDIKAQVSLAMQQNEQTDLYMQKLLEQNAKGLLPNSTFAFMLERYTREKELREQEIAKLVKLQEEEKKVLSAEKLSFALRELSKIRNFSPVLMQGLVKKIAIKCRGRGKSREIYITIIYYGEKIGEGLWE